MGCACNIGCHNLDIDYGSSGSLCLGGEARKNLKLWQNAPHQEKLKMELSYLHGAERPVPPRVSSIEAIMRVELLEKLPPWLARKCTIQGHYNTVDVLSKVLREMFLHEDL
eukprot:3423294-Amphidinium_carterae.1